MLQTTADVNQQTGTIKNGFIEKIRQHKLVVLGLLAALVMAVSVGGYFAFYSKKTSPTSIRDIKSVMVLPLKNDGGDAQDEYLSDGITDELTSRLNKAENYSCGFAFVGDAL